LPGLHKHNIRIVVFPFDWLIGSRATARRRERLNPTLEIVERELPRSTHSASILEKLSMAPLKRPAGRFVPAV
jgi:hypothetical protein